MNTVPEKLIGLACLAGWTAVAAESAGSGNLAAALAEPIAASVMAGAAVAANLTGKRRSAYESAFKRTTRRSEAALRSWATSEGIADNEIERGLQEFRRCLGFAMPSISELIAWRLEPKRIAEEFLNRASGEGSLLSTDALARQISTRLIEAAFVAVRDDPGFGAEIQPAFAKQVLEDLGETLASLRQIELNSESLKGDLRDVRNDTASMRVQLDSLVQAVTAQLDPTRLREAGIGRDVIVELARRIKPEEPLSFSQSIQEVRNAVEIALSVVEQGAHGSNFGSRVDTALRRIAERTSEGDLDGGTAEVDRAFAEWQHLELERRSNSKQEGLRLLEAGVAQDFLRRDPASAASRIWTKISFQHETSDARWRALAKASKGYADTGELKGLNLHLMVAVELARISLKGARGRLERLLALVELANHLQSLGKRETGSKHLAEAVGLFREALRSLNRRKSSRDWARIQSNLGVALQALGRREKRPALLIEAVRAERLALEAFVALGHSQIPADPDDETLPVYHNLAAALQALGELELRASALEEAVAIRRIIAGLPGLTQSQWAGSQAALGHALQALGQGTENISLLQEAVTAYDAAMPILTSTRNEEPFRWAVCSYRRGSTLKHIAGLQRLLDPALTAVRDLRAALEWFRQVSDLDGSPFVIDTETQITEALVLIGRLEGNAP